MKQITSNIYQIGLGSVNAFVIEEDGLTLIDTGVAGKTDQILTSIKASGKNPENIKRVIVTHLHNDHTGSVAEIKKRLNIPVYAHHTDAELIEAGVSGRPTTLTPGIINWLLFNLLIKKAGHVIAPVAIEEKLKDNDILPIAGGIQVIHTPGHSTGHIALLIKNEGVLIAGDICSNVFGHLAYTPIYEDRLLGKQSILKAAELSFDKALFGHGLPLIGKANSKLREAFVDTVV